MNGQVSFSLTQMFFCGASEFIERAGLCEFQHLINYVLHSFVSFSANWQTRIQCIRSDFFMSCDEKIVFRLRPSVNVNEKGICLCTCHLHSSGSMKAMFPVQRHPAVKNLS